MKVLILFLLVFICSCLIQAQEQPDKLQPIPFDNKNPGQPYIPFGFTPHFNLPNPETPVLIDSIVKGPGFIIGEDGNNRDASDYYNMPIVIPGPEFSSNMPIMVPDSSVHYYIQHVLPGKKKIKPRSNN